MFQLEKGSRKFNCPSCGNKTFVRYQNETGEYVGDDCGRCDRDSKCNYHRTPKDHFTQFGGKDDSSYKPSAKTRSQIKPSPTPEPSPDFISDESFNLTQTKKASAFTDFLFNLFREDAADVRRVLSVYRVGAFDDYTCFPSIDRENRICRAKLIRFNRTTGKRLHGQFDTSSLPSKLRLKENFEYKQIFFGEHLLTARPVAPVAIVEAEKTAIIAALCFPSLVWLATGSKQWLKAERLTTLISRKIVLYPDADGFNQWQQIAEQARAKGCVVETSELIEKSATDAEKAEGYDLADYLISEQMQINEHNFRADSYNAKLQKVLSDKNSLIEFERTFDLEKSKLMLYGNLPAHQAEQRVSELNNLRKIVTNLNAERQGNNRLYEPKSSRSVRH